MAIFKFNRVVNPICLSLLAVNGLQFIAGCSSENADSEDINASGIWASMKAEGRADETTRVVVELNVGGAFGTNVVLSRLIWVDRFRI